MQLKVDYFDQFIKDQCKNLVEYSSALELLFKEFNFDDKSKTDRLIIQITLAVQNLCGIAFPTPGSAEFFGAPKECTEAADKPDVIVVDRDHLDWNFKPWFKQKVNNIKQGFEGLIEYYEKDPDELKLSPNYEKSPKEFIVDMIVSDLGTINAFAKAILSMFESGRLTIRHVKLEEEF